MQDWPTNDEKREIKLEELTGGAIKDILKRASEEHPFIAEFHDLLGEMLKLKIGESLANLAFENAENWQESVEKRREDGEKIERQEVENMKKAWNESWEARAKAKRELDRLNNQIGVIINSPEKLEVISRVSDEFEECIKKYNPEPPSGLN